MIYRKAYPSAFGGFERGSRILVVDEDGSVPGEIQALTAVLADAAANGLIAALHRIDAEREHVRLRTIGDEVVDETGAGSGEGS